MLKIDFIDFGTHESQTGFRREARSILAKVVMKIVNVVGARPNFMKIAPLVQEMKKHPEIRQILVHTGQHYDRGLSNVFFEELGIPKPDINLGVGSGTHAEQTAKVMIEFEKVLLKEKPDLVIVVGDVNSTLACALVAAKLLIPVAHVEAGLRSFDRDMPEEINRVLTDQISDYLFATEESGVENLAREGIDRKKIFFVGNVMIDTLLKNKEKASKSRILESLKIEPRNYGILTLHRPSNVDDKNVFADILSALEEIQTKMPVVFPVHPRTLNKIKKGDLDDKIKKLENLIITSPLGYLDFLHLMSNAKFVLTDSGGVQEETTILGVPCLTLRKNTERPVTVTQGTNIIVGVDKKKIVTENFRIMKGKQKKGGKPKLWDGKAAERIVSVIRETLL